MRGEPPGGVRKVGQGSGEEWEKAFGNNLGSLGAGSGGTEGKKGGKMGGHGNKRERVTLTSHCILKEEPRAFIRLEG